MNLTKIKYEQLGYSNTIFIRLTDIRPSPLPCLVCKCIYLLSKSVVCWEVLVWGAKPLFSKRRSLLFVVLALPRWCPLRNELRSNKSTLCLEKFSNVSTPIWQKKTYLNSPPLSEKIWTKAFSKAWNSSKSFTIRFEKFSNINTSKWRYNHLKVHQGCEAIFKCKKSQMAQNSS